MKKSVAGWMMVGTGIGIAAAVLGTKTMKAQNKKGLKANVMGLKSQAASMIKDDLAENAAQMAKKTGNVLIKAGTTLDNSIKN